MKKRITITLLVVAALVAIIFPIAFYVKDRAGKGGIKDKYEELEFVVVHRPQLTYFVDTKYFLCFATRKPDYQDLVQFICPERMWKDVEQTIQARATGK